jgi:hypothetical protein
MRSKITVTAPPAAVVGQSAKSKSHCPVAAPAGAVAPLKSETVDLSGLATGDCAPRRYYKRGLGSWAAGGGR